jgi:hypothetical protein
VLSRKLRHRRYMLRNKKIVLTCTADGHRYINI